MGRLALFASLSLLALAGAEARTVPMPPDPTGASAERPLQERREREPGPANLEEAVEIAIERYGGTTTRAETVERDGRRVHEIRLLLDDGSVRTVRIDPATGAIIPPPRDR